MIVVIGAPYGAEVKVETEGRMGCRVVIQRDLQVLEIGMTDEQARELVRQLNAHLDRRAAERTLAMLEAERERRRRAERPETLAVMAEVRVKEEAACGDGGRRPDGQGWVKTRGLCRDCTKAAGPPQCKEGDKRCGC